MTVKNPKREKNRYPEDHESLAIKLTGVSVENFSNPNFESDYAAGVLLHDALGLKAKFDASGRPETNVRFRILPPEVSSIQSASSGIAGLYLQNGRWNPFPPDDIVVLNLAYYNSDTGIIRAGWMNTGVRNSESGLEACIAAGNDGVPNLMTVDPERYIERLDGAKNFFQNRFRVLQTEALEFRGIRDFKKKAAMLLDIFPELQEDGEEFDHYESNFDGRGYPCIAVRMISLHDKEGNPGVFAYARRIELHWDHGLKMHMSPQDTVNRFLDNKINASWIDFIKNSIKKNAFYELIPMQRYYTHAQSLPSSARKTGAVDDSNQFPAPVLDEYNNLILNPNRELAIVNGFAESIMIANRSANSPEDRWLARKNIRTNLSGPISPLAEIQTPNLSDELRDILQVRAERRANCIQKYHKRQMMKEFEATSKSSAYFQTNSVNSEL